MLRHVCLSVCPVSKSVNIFVLTKFGIIYSEWRDSDQNCLQWVKKGNISGLHELCIATTLGGRKLKVTEISFCCIFSSFSFSISHSLTHPFLYLRITWESLRNHLEITRESLRNHLEITWESLRNHIGITWESLGNHLGLRRLDYPLLGMPSDCTFEMMLCGGMGTSVHDILVDH